MPGPDSASDAIRTPRPFAPIRADRMLVIGGSGFLGSEVVRAACEAGRSVSVLARHRPDISERPWLGAVDWFVGTATDESDVRRAMEGVGWVVDAVGCPPPAAADFSRASMLVQTVPTLSLLLDILRKTPGVGVTYFSSGGTVYGQTDGRPVTERHPCAPVSPYGMTKLLAEQCLEDYSHRFGIPIRILRVANAYGPAQSASDGQGLIAACVEAALGHGGLTIFGDGGNVRDYVEVADVAAAVMGLPPTLDDHRTVNVGSGTGHRVDEVLALLSEITGARFHVRRLPARPQDVASIVLDTSRLAELIPWNPKPLVDGVGAVWRDRVGRMAAPAAVHTG
ncbi:MAG: NAD-dependent epimerase/dehydratase family protein [Acidimicrobiales bacterium]|jgi:UDP-glucose 4-epimerase